jgi:hypothetical protein
MNGLVNENARIKNRKGGWIMKTALMLIDIQNDYFPQGAMELEGRLEAGRNAGEDS